LAGGDSPSLEIIVKHIATHVGDATTVIHELASQYVHVDVHVVPPRPDRDFYTLVTSGMSNRPMKVPRQVKGKGLEFAELMLCLPRSWETNPGDAITSETWEKDWPVIWLRRLARFPHEYGTWLSWGHSIPNGDPAAPFSPDTELCGWVLMEPKLVSDSFKCLLREDGSKVFFHAAVPVYKEEMAVKIAQGADRLEELFGEYGVTELLDPKRMNVAAKLRSTKQ
jgi:Suppressor of fused protein (SUFU)